MRTLATTVCGALLAGALMGAAPAAALEMQPGQWRFTQTTSAGGKSASRTKIVCISPAQAKDPARYFQPLGRGCAIASHSDFGGRISSTLRCQQGKVSSEVTSTISFSSGSELTITTRMTAGDAVAIMNGSGKRIGECGARGRRTRKAR